MTLRAAPSLVLLASIAQACSSAPRTTSASTGAAADGTGSANVADAAMQAADAAHGPTHTEVFPEEPVFEGDAPRDATDKFAQSESDRAGPCLLEPEDGALVPNNWLRPRVRFKGDAELYEVRFHVEGLAHDFVAYTTRSELALPQDVWDRLRQEIVDTPVQVSVRGLADDGHPTRASAVQLTVAPVSAEGTLVYWAAVGEKSGESWLRGFEVGEESTRLVLETKQVTQKMRDQGGNPKANGGAVECMGCHVSTPDGLAVAFTDHWPWSNVVASLDKNELGHTPSTVSEGGVQAISQPWLGIQSFSPAHWQDGDRIVISSYSRTGGSVWDGATWSDSPNAKLAWLDLEAPASKDGKPVEGVHYGFIARSGDAHGVAAPDFSNDGERIVYVSTDANKDGRLARGIADLYVVPYAKRAGGAAHPLEGAATSEHSEYYPAFSPDDALVAFNRAPADEDMYYNARSEIFVIDAKGGEPLRLRANDPPACAGVESPGITNSWAKWSPEVQVVDGRRYYWLVFSSSRDGYHLQKLPEKRASQLYMTAVVVEPDGTMRSYPSIYLWNQPVDESNHTPAWDVFRIDVL